MSWLELARREIGGTRQVGTADSDEGPPTAVSAALSRVASEESQTGQVRADLAARALARMQVVCTSMGIGPNPIARQLEGWDLTVNDWQELLSWSDSTVRAHIVLLAHEVESGVRA